MRRFARILVASLAAASLAAQNTSTERAQAELARSQRALQQNKSEVERLLDMRVRHDLGLPAEDSANTFRPNAPVTTEGMERARQELRDEDAATAALLERYKKLKNDVDQLQAEARSRAEIDARARELVVPPANVRPLRSTPQAQTSPADARHPATPERPLDPLEVPPAPGGENSAGRKPSSAVPAVVDLGLDPVRGQIHGSDDHQRVAQALFKAGQVLMDRADVAREQKQDDAAREFDTRAKERLVRAIDELQPLLADREPTYQSLFYLGRCRELLFRLSERYDGLSLANSTTDYQKREQEVREPFLSISARDVAKKGERGEIEVLGPWGMAAQTAMEHFRWLNLNGGYDPRPQIRALTWPGEQAQ